MSHRSYSTPVVFLYEFCEIPFSFLFENCIRSYVDIFKRHPVSKKFSIHWGLSFIRVIYNIYLNVSTHFRWVSKFCQYILSRGREWIQVSWSICGGVGILANIQNYMRYYIPYLIWTECLLMIIHLRLNHMDQQTPTLHIYINECIVIDLTEKKAGN